MASRSKSYNWRPHPVGDGNVLRALPAGGSRGRLDASGARHPFHVRAEDALQSASEAPPPSSHSMCFSGQTPSVDDGRRSKRPFAALCVHSPATEQVGGCALPSSRRGRRGDVGRHVPGARDAGRHQTRPRVRILCTLLPSAIMNSSS